MSSGKCTVHVLFFVRVDVSVEVTVKVNEDSSSDVEALHVAFWFILEMRFGGHC